MLSPTSRILTSTASRRCVPLSRTFNASIRRDNSNDINQSRTIRVGDRIPDAQLVENSPGNQVSLAETLSTGKGLIIGVPAAFSPGCSQRHVPGYIKCPRLREVAGQVFVVSVNDPFVMKAWAESLDPGNRSGIRFLGDPHATFTNALGLTFDATAIFGHPRSKRYALFTEDGNVTGVHVEPDNTGVNVSAAEKVLGSG